MAREEHAIHVHPALGADAHSRARDAPLRTLAGAARRVNEGDGAGAATIVLAEGVYSVGETTVLKPERRSFSRTERLTIRAEVLPDDPGWHLGRMPTLVHTMPLPAEWNGRPDPLGGAANGFEIETSHVSIRGLRLLGMPVVESPQPGLKRRFYAISRLGRDLEDLEVAQCLFAGDELTVPLHAGVIARGDGLVVHHCVFRGFMKDAVVYWTAGSRGHAMRHCLFHGVYGSTVWTSAIADGFEYRNNVVDGANYAWVYQSGASAQADAGGRRAQLPGAAPTPRERNRYRVVDSWFANSRRLAGAGTGARIEFEDIDPSFLELVGTTTSDQPVALERDQTRRDYLHPVVGSEPAKLHAGLFLQPTG